MPEIIPSGAPYPKAVLGWDGTAYRVFSVDAAGQLQVDVIASGLPAGAATAAHQATMVTALQLIDDLQTALQSVGTDRLQVRGEDQLFSFREVLGTYTAGNPSGASGYIASPVVGPGEIWVVTNVVVRDNTTPITAVYFSIQHDGVGHDFGNVTAAIPAGQRTAWGGHVYLDVNDMVRVWLIGSLAGDTCNLWVTGYRMTLEV